MVSALQHQPERCSVELRIRKPSDTLVPGGMDSPPTPMYVPHSPWDPGKRCTGAEVIGTTLQEPLYSVDAHHSTCWFWFVVLPTRVLVPGLIKFGCRHEMRH